MEKYIALLRGINVSGQKKIKMADLKTALEDLNFKNVTTYIQSGNIVFGYPESDLKVLEKLIHDQIEQVFGFDVSTLVITIQDLINVTDKNPFHQREDVVVEKSYITFLDQIPSEERIPKLYEVDYAPEEFILEGRYIFFYSPVGYGKAKMNNNWFEQKLKVKATTRNWNTVNKLLAMSKMD